jgi:hypothetical protein
MKKTFSKSRFNNVSKEKKENCRQSRSIIFDNGSENCKGCDGRSARIFIPDAGAQRQQEKFQYAILKSAGCAKV